MDTKKTMELEDSSQESSISVPQEKGSSWPSSGSVLDGHVVKNCDCFDNSFGGVRSFSGNLEGNPCLEMVKTVMSDVDDHEEVVVDDDVHEVLPMDPFEMNDGSAFASIAVSNSIKSFEEGETHKKTGDRLRFFRRSWSWNGSDNLQSQKYNVKEDGISVSAYVFNGYQNFDGIHECDGGIVTDGNSGELPNVSHRDNLVSSSEVKESQNNTEVNGADQGGFPHEALFYVLGYLRVQDLLSVEQVCRSFRDTVRGDPLLWKTVHIHPPLTQTITDDALKKLTDRAQGSLQSLIIASSYWVSDISIGHVLQNNPRLVKLAVPQCSRVTVQSILFHLKALKSSGTLHIKHLRIAGLRDVSRVTEQQFEELKELLGASMYLQHKDPKPKFYRGGYSHTICDDGRAIDVEICPVCKKLRRVYDCPIENCQKDHQSGQLCRGCTLCIARCIKCGRCIKDIDFEETFFLDFRCVNCGVVGNGSCIVIHFIKEVA